MFNSIKALAAFLALAALSATAELVPVEYSHEGDDLLGFMVAPANMTNGTMLPAIVIIP